MYEYLLLIFACCSRRSALSSPSLNHAHLTDYWIVEFEERIY